MKIVRNFFLLYLFFIGVQNTQAMTNISQDVIINFLDVAGRLSNKRYFAGPLDTQQWYSPVVKHHDFAVCLTEYAQLVCANSCEKENSLVFELITQGLLARLTRSLEQAFICAENIGYVEANDYTIGMQLFKADHYDKSIISNIWQGLTPILPILHHVRHHLNAAHRQHAFTLCSAYVFSILGHIPPFKEYIKTLFAKAYIIPPSIRQIFKAVMKIPLATLQQFGVQERGNCTNLSVPASPKLGIPPRTGQLSSSLPPANRPMGAIAKNMYYSQPLFTAQKPPADFIHNLQPLQRADSFTPPMSSTPVVPAEAPFKVPALSPVRPMNLGLEEVKHQDPYAETEVLMEPTMPQRAPSPMVPFVDFVLPRNTTSAKLDAPQQFKDPDNAVQFIVITFGHKQAIRSQGFNRGTYKAYLLSNFTFDQLKLIADFFDSKGGRLVRARHMAYNEVGQGSIYAFFGGMLLKFTPEERNEFLTVLGLADDNEFLNSLILLRQKVEQRTALPFASPAPVAQPMQIDGPQPAEPAEGQGIKRKHSDNFVCPICYEEFEEPSLMTTLDCTCNFYYHRACLEGWWKAHPQEKRGRKKKNVYEEANKECPTCHKKSLTLHDPKSLKKK